MLGPWQWRLPRQATSEACSPHRRYASSPRYHIGPCQWGECRWEVWAILRPSESRSGYDIKQLGNLLVAGLTGVCGVLGTQETSVASAIDSMLKAMWRRGSSTRSFTTRAGKGHYVGIGMCDHPSQPSTGFQFHGDLVVAVDGFFYDPLKLVKAALRKGQPQSLSELVTLPGAFSFVAVGGEQLYAGREPVGQKPLYYGEGPNGVLVVASLDRKS